MLSDDYSQRLINRVKVETLPEKLTVPLERPFFWGVATPLAPPTGKKTTLIFFSATEDLSALSTWVHYGAISMATIIKRKLIIQCPKCFQILCPL